MRNKIKYVTILSILTTLLFCNSIFADQKIYSNGDLRFTVNEEDGSITIVDYFGKSDEVKIPMTIGIYEVKHIAADAFKNSNIKKVEIPDTIEEIDSKAFNDIDSIEIKVFDAQDVEKEMDIPIVYPEKIEDPIEEKQDEPKEEKQDNKDSQKENAEKDKNEDQNDNISQIDEDITTTIIDVGGNEDIFEEDTTEEDNIEKQQSNAEENISIDGSEEHKIDVNSYEGSSKITNTSLQSEGYIIIAVIMIGVVAYIVFKKRK